jgi:hypothetical protein
MSPGAYASITKVDFKTLDRLSIQPMGIYGCRDEIVRLLQSLGSVDQELYVAFISTSLVLLNHLAGLSYCLHQAVLVVPR